MSELSPENSYRLRNLSFLCACGVVISHMPWPAGFANLRSLLTVTPVQYFFIVAGYFLAAHFGEAGWWRKAVFSRVRSLLVPYVLWLAVTMALMWAFTGRCPISCGNIGLDLRKVPLLVPLWFVRALLLLVLASPLIRLTLVRWGLWYLLAVFLAAGGVQAMLIFGIWTVDGGCGGLLYYGLPVEGLFYFSLGMWLRSRKFSGAGLPRKALILLAASVAVALCLVADQLRLPACFAPTLVTVPFCLAALWHLTPASPWPKAVVGSSFAIYVTHAVVLGAVWLATGTRECCPLWLAALIGILVPLAFNLILKRALPKVANVLFGGR